MLSTVTLGDLGDLRAGFNAAVSGAAGGRRRGRLTWIFTDLRLPPARVATPGHGPQRAQPPASWLRPIPDQIAGVAGTHLFSEMPRAGSGGEAGAFGPEQPLGVGDNRGQWRGRRLPGRARRGIWPRRFGALLPASSPLSLSLEEAGLRPAESDGRRPASQPRGERGELGPGCLAAIFSSVFPGRDHSGVF